MPSNFAAMVYKKVHEPLQLDTGPAATLPDSLKPVISEGTRHGGGRPLFVDARAQSRLARRARTDTCRRT